MHRTCWLLLVIFHIALNQSFFIRAQTSSDGDVAKLLTQLEANSSKERWAAAKKLSQMQPVDETVIPKLIAALRNKSDFYPGADPFDEQPDLRVLIVRTLRRIGNEGEKALATTGVSILIKDLANEKTKVQEHTLRALAAMGSLAEKGIPTVARIAKAQNGGAHDQALATLRGMGPKAMPILLQLVKNEDAFEKTDALDVARRNMIPNESNASLLIDFLNDANPRVRCRAAMALQKCGAVATSAIPTLLKRLADHELDEAAPRGVGNLAVADALASIGKPAIPGLIKALDHPNLLVKVKALYSLGEIGPSAKPASKFVRPFLKAKKVGPLVTAAVALLQIGDDQKQPISILAQLLKHPSADVRYYTLQRTQLLRRPRMELLPALQRLFDDPYPLLIREAFETVADYGADAKPALPKLLPLLAREPLRFDLLNRLKDLGPLPKDATPWLSKCLLDKDHNNSWRAAELLAMMGPKAKAAVPALMKALDGEYLLQRAAVEALGRIGEAAKPAIPKMTKLYMHPPFEARNSLWFKQTIVLAFGDLGVHAKETVPFLMQQLKKPGEPHQEIVRALGGIGADAKAAVPMLRQRLASAKGAERTELLGALALITGKRAAYAVSLIKQLKMIPLDRRHRKERQTTIDALARLGQDARPAVPVVIGMLKKEEDFQIRRSIVHLLGGLGMNSSKAIPQLLTLLREGDLQEKVDVINCLGAIGPPAKAAIPALEIMCCDRQARIRNAAREALRKIQLEM